MKSKNLALSKRVDTPEWYKELSIFPGVEITVADSRGRVHLPAIFDPSCDGQQVTAVLGACGIIDGFGDDQQTSTSQSFVETVREIERAGGIAVPAHIDGPKGLLETAASLTPELEKSLKSIFAAELCNIHKFDSADPPLKKAVERTAKVAGSDAHTPDEIGRYYSWVKRMSCSNKFVSGKTPRLS